MPSALRLPPLLATLVLASCATVHRPRTTVDALRRDLAGATATEQAVVDSIVDRLARRAIARGDGMLDVLLLSGGGQDGAYGAGFLRGWRARADAPMPAFDLVTGVSTGALQATYAFLGTAEGLDTLATLYREAADRFAPTIDWWFWLRRSGGVVRTGRLRKTIAAAFDSGTRVALRAAVRDGRQLAVSTTDFDLALGRTWDLGPLLAADSVARVQQLLLASASIPGVFPPQVLDGRVHADGGIVSNVLPVLGVAEYERLGRRLREAGHGPVTVRVWTVLNIWTQAGARVMDPASVGGMSRRTLSLLFWTRQPQLVARLDELARAVNGSVEGVRVELRVTSIPHVAAYERGANALFSRPFMEWLEREGYARARGASPWDLEPPTPRRASR